MVRAAKASDPAKPFFLYFAHGAVHAPLHAKPDDIAKYRGPLRRRAGTCCARRASPRSWSSASSPPARCSPPRNTEPRNDVPPWDELPTTEQELFARYMEVYAAMVDNVDQQLRPAARGARGAGRAGQHASSCSPPTTARRARARRGHDRVLRRTCLSHSDIDGDLARLDEIGGPTTTPHYPRGWAMASNTPFRLYKINTHAGGHRSPIVGWPRRPRRVAGRRAASAASTRTSPTSCPTLLDAARHRRLPAQRRGHAARRAGRQPASRRRSPTRTRPSAHREQLFEMTGHRGYYRDGWEVVTLHRPLTPFDDGEWELYDLAADRTELRDLAAEHPDRVAELAAAWEQAAWANQVFPLDEGSRLKYLVRPPRTERLRPARSRCWPGTPTLERWRSPAAHLVRAPSRSTSRSSTPPATPASSSPTATRAAATRCTSTAADLHWVLQRRPGPHPRPRRRRRAARARVEVVADVHAPGGGTWTVSCGSTATERATRGRLPLLFPMAPFEGINVGIDRTLAGVVGAVRAARAVPVHRRACARSPTRPASPLRTPRSPCSTCCARWARASSRGHRSGPILPRRAVHSAFTNT